MNSEKFTQDIKIIEDRHGKFIARLNKQSVRVKIDTEGFTKARDTLADRYKRFIKKLNDSPTQKLRLGIDNSVFTRTSQAFKNKYQNFVTQLNKQSPLRVSFTAKQFNQAAKLVKRKYFALIKELSNRKIEVKIDTKGFQQVLDRFERQYKAFGSSIVKANEQQQGATTSSRSRSSRITPEATRFASTIAGATPALSAFGAFAGATLPLATVGMAGLGVAALAMGRQVVLASADFEKAMDHVLAISQATGREFSALTQRASKLGVTTIFTAEQVAEGMGFLAQAGFDANEILGSIESTLHLAQAGNLDLARAADIASNALTAFRIDTADTVRVVDAMAFGAASSNTNVEQLGDALARVGGIASALNIPIETSVALIGKFGDAGIQSHIAGRALRLVLQRIVAPLKGARAGFAQLNVQMRDNEGNARNTIDILFDLITRINDIPDSLDRARLATEIFGTESALYFQVLASEGVDNLKEAIEEMGGAVGFAAKTARIQTDNMRGDLTRLQSAWNGLSRTIGDIVSGPLRNFTQGLTEATNLASRVFGSEAEGPEVERFVIADQFVAAYKEVADNIRGVGIPAALRDLREQLQELGGEEAVIAFELAYDETFGLDRKSIDAALATALRGDPIELINAGAITALEVEQIRAGIVEARRAAQEPPKSFTSDREETIKRLGQLREIVERLGAEAGAAYQEEFNKSVDPDIFARVVRLNPTLETLDQINLAKRATAKFRSDQKIADNNARAADLREAQRILDEKLAATQAYYDKVVENSKRAELAITPSPEVDLSQLSREEFREFALENVLVEVDVEIPPETQKRIEDLRTHIAELGNIHGDDFEAITLETQRLLKVIEEIRKTTGALVLRPRIEIDESVQRHAEILKRREDAYNSIAEAAERARRVVLPPREVDVATLSQEQLREYGNEKILIETDVQIRPAAQRNINVIEDYISLLKSSPENFGVFDTASLNRGIQEFQKAIERIKRDEGALVFTTRFEGDKEFREAVEGRGLASVFNETSSEAVLLDGILDRLNTSLATTVDIFAGWEDASSSVSNVLKQLARSVANFVVQITILEPLLAKIREIFAGGGAGSGDVENVIENANTALRSGGKSNTYVIPSGLQGGVGVGAAVRSGFGGTGGGLGLGDEIRSGFKPAGKAAVPLSGTTINVYSTSLDPQAAGEFASGVVSQTVRGLSGVVRSEDLRVY